MPLGGTQSARRRPDRPLSRLVDGIRGVTLHHAELVHSVVFAVVSSHDLFEDLDWLELITKGEGNIACVGDGHVV